MIMYVYYVVFVLRCDLFILLFSLLCIKLLLLYILFILCVYIFDVNIFDTILSILILSALVYIGNLVYNQLFFLKKSCIVCCVIGIGLSGVISTKTDGTPLTPLL